MTQEARQLVEQAARCFRLARECTDREFARRLIELGPEFTKRAMLLGIDPEGLPPA